MLTPMEVYIFNLYGHETTNSGAMSTGLYLMMVKI